MVPIVKSAFPPPNTEALWVDLSVKPIVLKIFHTNGWTPVSDPSSLATDVKEIQEAIAEIEKFNKTALSKGDLATIDGASLEEGGNIDLSKVYLSLTKAAELYVPLEGYVASDQNFTEDMKKKLAGIEEGANKTVIDSALNGTSTNPVQNKVINTALTAAATTAANALKAHTDDANIHVPSGGIVGQVLMSDGKGSTSWANADLIDLLSYGVEWDHTTGSNPNCTRIGNPLLHKSLPIQSALRGCVANGSKINYYLNADNWAYMEDGTTPSILDGSEGTVRVDTGAKFYGKSWVIGNKRQVRISTVQIDSTWTEIPRLLIDAYRSTVDTTDASAPKAVSVVNTTAAFRGGNNDASKDAYIDTDIFRTQLGKPRTNISRATMRTYAHNAGSHVLCYEWYKWVLYWLPVIEYATFNMQQSFNATPTAEGYKQGGLGAGVTNMGDTNWSKYNGYYPLTPCGYANSLGNHTGIVTFTTPADADAGVTEVTHSIARWRGIENIFGDIWTNLDGIILQNDVTTDNGSGTYLYKNVYVSTDPEQFADALNESYKIVGKEINTDGYTGEFDLGSNAEIIPLVMGGDSTKKKCDYHWTGTKADTSLRTLLVGGRAFSGALAGLGFFYSDIGVGHATASFGFRTSNVVE